MSDINNSVEIMPKASESVAPTPTKESFITKVAKNPSVAGFGQQVVVQAGLFACTSLLLHVGNKAVEGAKHLAAKGVHQLKEAKEARKKAKEAKKAEAQQQVEAEPVEVPSEVEQA